MRYNPDFLERAKRNINLNDFDEISSPIIVERNVSFELPEDRQYILRMLVGSPFSNGLQIPDELNWLKPTIENLQLLQKKNRLKNPYVYVTVRHGLVTTKTDDQWHVDGFSMKKPCKSDQNYSWCNHTPTEYYLKNVIIPMDFNPHKHDLNKFIHSQIELEVRDVYEFDFIDRFDANSIVLFDSYLIHKRPAATQDQMRSFWRVSFLDIEIEDDRNTPNPLIPRPKFNNIDIRTTLNEYE
jgi:hypothetical protein